MLKEARRGYPRADEEVRQAQDDVYTARNESSVVRPDRRLRPYRSEGRDEHREVREARKLLAHRCGQEGGDRSASRGTAGRRQEAVRRAEGAHFPGRNAEGAA